MIKCVAIYPSYITEEYVQKVKESVKLAAKHHFDEIFTTVHLPEYTFEDQLNTFQLIANEAKKYNLDVTVDIRGSYIAEILKNKEKLEFVKKIDFDFVRLDYGYEKEQVKTLYDELNIRGFVFNASIYSKEEVDEMMSFFKSIDDKIEIRACHNYYIRNESGMDAEYAKRQDSYLKEYQVPIYYCVPTYSNPRGPLHLGLCSVEKHRGQSIRSILTDLSLNYHLTAFMMADEWLKTEEYAEVEETLDVLGQKLNKEEVIDICFLENTSQEEKEIVLGVHTFRNDSPDQFLRSESSRPMAEFASVVKKNHTIERQEGFVTIDNELNKRYSGELQVVTRKACEDERVNVVARLVHPKDIVKLLRFREGISYRFREVES